MYNLYYYFLVLSVLLQIFTQSLVAIKIDQTLNLINEQLIISCVTEQSKLETYNGTFYERLELDKDLVKLLVEENLQKNLPFVDVEVKYYFYDYTTTNSCLIGQNYCNSVQMKIVFKYQNKEYERILRYEPIQT